MRSIGVGTIYIKKKKKEKSVKKIFTKVSNKKKIEKKK